MNPFKCIVKTSFLATGLILCLAMNLYGQPLSGGKSIKAQRKYDIIVNQTNDTIRFNRSLRSLRANSEKLNNRGIVADLLSGYLSLGTSTLLSASQNLLGAGISMVKEAARDKRPDWEKAANGENRFVKQLPMVTEIIDFYGAPSSIGALDPSDMKFSGFGCRQYITMLDDQGKPFDNEVFYISCSIRDDEDGIARMLNHSKFEVVVDELRFNPYLSNLPNDTLSIDDNTRIPFSFNNRSDLQFKMTAKLFSSWINEAIQIHKDVPLGEFTVVAKINPEQLDDDNVFRYSRNNENDKEKVVYVTGDSFLVPRSYVGSSDMKNNMPSWGTGQYRVEMKIEESCRLNDRYYKSEDGKKWVKEKWMPEWKKMKKRPKKGASQNIATMMFPQFSGDQWITTLIEPASSILLQNENLIVNKTSSKIREVWDKGSAPSSYTPSSSSPASGSGYQKSK